MKIIAAAPLLALCLACSGPDPFDEVRSLRRQYAIEIDWIFSDEDREMTYEIKVQNQTSGIKLFDLTVVAQVLDEGQNVIWSKMHTLDISEIGSYSSKSFQFKETLELDPMDVQYFNVVLAPDAKDSEEWKTYKEFLRAIE